MNSLPPMNSGMANNPNSMPGDPNPDSQIFNKLVNLINSYPKDKSMTLFRLFEAMEDSDEREFDKQACDRKFFQKIMMIKATLPSIKAVIKNIGYIALTMHKNNDFYSRLNRFKVDEYFIVNEAMHPLVFLIILHHGPLLLTKKNIPSDQFLIGKFFALIQSEDKLRANLVQADGGVEMNGLPLQPVVINGEKLFLIPNDNVSIQFMPMEDIKSKYYWFMLQYVSFNKDFATVISHPHCVIPISHLLVPSYAKCSVCGKPFSFSEIKFEKINLMSQMQAISKQLSEMPLNMQQQQYQQYLMQKRQEIQIPQQYNETRQQNYTMPAQNSQMQQIPLISNNSQNYSYQYQQNSGNMSRTMSIDNMQQSQMSQYQQNTMNLIQPQYQQQNPQQQNSMGQMNPMQQNPMTPMQNPSMNSMSQSNMSLNPMQQNPQLSQMQPSSQMTPMQQNSSMNSVPQPNTPIMQQQPNTSMMQQNMMNQMQQSQNVMDQISQLQQNILNQLQMQKSNMMNQQTSNSVTQIPQQTQMNMINQNPEQNMVPQNMQPIQQPSISINEANANSIYPVNSTAQNQPSTLDSNYDNYWKNVYDENAEFDNDNDYTIYDPIF